MEHSEKCQAEFAKIKQEIEEYESKWPNYCRSCGGWGVHNTSQSVPYGSTSASFDVSDPCVCHDSGKCARCAGELTDEWFDGDLKKCPHCGWNWGNDVGDIIPELPDWCECLAAEEVKLEKEAEEYFNNH